MTTRTVVYWLERRKNAYVGYEWALHAALEDDSQRGSWTLWTWHPEDTKNHAPSEDEVKKVMTYLSHAMDFAVRNIARWEPPYLKAHRAKERDAQMSCMHGDHDWTPDALGQADFKCLNCGALGQWDNTKPEPVPYSCMKPGCREHATDMRDGVRYCLKHR